MPSRVHEQERAILSVAIQFGREYLKDLREEEFDAGSHRAIFRAIQRCNGACDLPILTDKLTASRDIPNLMSIVELNDLAMMEATPYSATTYFKAIRDAAKLRDEALLARHLAERIERGEVDAAEIERHRKAEQARIDSRDLDAEASDIAAANRFIARHGDKVRYCHQLGMWYVWNGCVWSPDTSQRVLDLARECARQFSIAALDSGDRARVNKALSYEGANRIQGAVKLASADPRVNVRMDDLDRHPELLGVQNGIVDLRTGMMVKPDPSLLMTQQTVVPFDPSATCPRWEAFVREVMLVREDLVDFLQHWVGYCLTGETREQVMVVAYGGGANGKGTFWDTIRLHVLGRQLADEAPPKLLLSRSQENHPAELMVLFGRRLITASEVPQSSRWDESRVKLLTGQDTIQARGMHQDFKSFPPTHKLVSYLNSRPDVGDATHSFWRRIRLLPFEAQFDSETADPLLREKLEREAIGILAWGIRGSVLYYKNGLPLPKAIEDATADYRNDQDHVARFIHERSEEGSQPTLMAAKLYDEFKTWWEGQGFDVKHVMSMKSIAKRLKSMGFSAKRMSSGMLWDISPASCRVYGCEGRKSVTPLYTPAERENTGLGVHDATSYTDPVQESLDVAENLGPGADDDWR